MRISKTERTEAIGRLRELCPPGTLVYTILRHVSKSGMSRVIDPVLLPENGTDPRGHPYYLGSLAARAVEYANDGDQGVKVSGCGMDMGWHLIYSLSSVLYPGGFACIGKNCPANDHVNVRGLPDSTWHNDGGYALVQRWL